MYARRGVVTVHFFHNHNYQEGTGKFIDKASIFDSKQLLSNMTAHEATQVPHTTRIVFLADSYLYILLKIPLHYSYIAT